MMNLLEESDGGLERIRILGKRVEKIIFIGLLLAFLSSMLLLLSNAIQSTRINELTYIIDAYRLCALENKAELISEREKYEKYVAADLPAIEDLAHLYGIYSCNIKVLRKSVSDDLFSYDSHSAIEEILKKAPAMKYEEIDPYLENIKEKISNEPLKIQGIELSRSIEFSIFGNKIKTDFDNLLYPIKFLYAIVLSLWLLSFKRSRSIEILAIKRYAKDITYVYPHFLNTYGVIQSEIVEVPLRIEKRIPGKKTHARFPDGNAFIRIFYTVALFLVIIGPFSLTFIEPSVVDWMMSFLTLLLLGIISFIISAWIEFDTFNEAIYFHQ